MSLSSTAKSVMKPSTGSRSLLEKIQSQLFISPQALTIPPSQKHRHLLYHTPDICPLKLSEQDPSLAKLQLVDVDLQSKKERQDRYAARGKNIRVCVIDGPQSPPDKVDKKKKK